jgi:hypothetical protein
LIRLFVVLFAVLVSCADRAVDDGCVPDELRRCGCDDAWTELGWELCVPGGIWTDCECDR